MRPLRLLAVAVVVAVSGCPAKLPSGPPPPDPAHAAALRDAIATLRKTASELSEAADDRSGAALARLSKRASPLEPPPAIYDVTGFPPEIVRAHVELVAELGTLRAVVDAEAKAAGADRIAPAAARYAVFLDGDQHGAKLVELGPPLCDGKAAHGDACPEGALAEPMFRARAGSPWTRGRAAVPGDDAVPAGSLVMLLPTEPLDVLVRGAESTVADRLRQARLNEIRALSSRIIQDAARLEGRFARIAAAPGGRE